MANLGLAIDAVEQKRADKHYIEFREDARYCGSKRADIEYQQVSAGLMGIMETVLPLVELTTGRRYVSALA